MTIKYLLYAILVGFLGSGCQTTKPAELAAFEFDGCSCFPEGTLKQPDLWEENCLKHDYAYWKGGSRIQRKAADLEFREGVRGKGKPVIAQIAYVGVRLGGSPWLPASWRWGFGWKEFPRGYRELNEDEKRRVKESPVEPPGDP